MMKQCVKVLFGIENVEDRINTVVEEMNGKGWILEQVATHYSRQSNWCLVFKKGKN